MRAALRFWRYLYGENPLHLLAMVACFALVGYAVSFVFPGPSALALGIWFAGAVLGHDLVLYPLYALADQPLTILRWGRRRVLPRRPPLVPAINHVRAPALGSAVLGLIYFPTIDSRGEDAFRFTSGLGTPGIFGNWLLITGVLFGGSAVIYAVRLGAAAGRVVVGRRRADVTLGAPVAAGDGAAAESAQVDERTLTEDAETETSAPATIGTAHEDSALAENAPADAEGPEPDGHGPETDAAGDVAPEQEPASSRPRTDPGAQ